MIRSISSDKPSFRTVTFKDGLNVILATKTLESNRKDSTNGLGKSTIVDILHFCLGGDRSGVLSNSVLDGWTFTLTLDIGGRVYSVSRTATNYAKVLVDGDCSNWPVLPKTVDGKQVFTVRGWKDALGSMMYGLVDQNMEYGPTLRSLLSYFVRRDSQGGYGDPFLNHSRQLTWDKQVHNAYLLGLDWKLASQKQVLRDKDATLKLVRKKAAEVAVGDTLGGEAELEATRIRLADEIEVEKEHIDNFRIHETYRRLEEGVDEMTEKIHEMLNQNVGDRRILELYQASMMEEADADPAQIAQIYKEAGLLFPDEVTKRLEDVRQFHKKIVQNRRDYLRLEIDNLNAAVLRRDQEIQEIGRKKTKIMNILKTHGALDEFLQIQENHQGQVSALEDVTNRLKILRDIGNAKDALALDSARLLQKMKSDLAERVTQRTDAIRAFNLYSKNLYNEPGMLSIGTSSSGYTFDVRIERSDSHGYKNMKIFCYDLTLARLWASKQTSPGFLVHDSVIFADVDMRQVAHAIQLANTESRQHQYQYICMMNSDSVPLSEFDSNFNFDSHVIIQLTDATENGSILGIRF